MSESQESSMLYRQNNLSEFERGLGLNFNDKALLVTALSHKSPLGSKITSKDENKKLALMGDKLIDLLLFKVVYDRGATPLNMNAARTHTENIELDKVADKLGFGKYLFLEDSANEEIREKSVSFGSDSIEGLAGAIFLDAGFETAQRFVNTWILPILFGQK